MVRRKLMNRDRETSRDSADELPEVGERSYDDLKHARRFDGLVKQLNIPYDVHRYKLIRDEAIRRGVTMATLLRSWIDPHVDQLPHV